MKYAPHIYEQLEAFREGVDNLDAEPWNELRAALEVDPELRERLSLVQHHDATMRTALETVTVPVGLSERLLARIGSSDIARTAPSYDVASEVSLPQREVAPQPKRFPRRTLEFAGGALALVALIALATNFSPPTAPREDMATREELNAFVEALHRDPGLRNAEGWSKSMAGVARSHPIDSSITVAPVQWRRIAARPAGSAVVYQLARKGTTAHLFVTRTSRHYPVPELPMTSWSLTGSNRAGAWQRGDLLYVLVVNEGDGALLEDFVRVPPLT